MSSDHTYRLGYQDGYRDGHRAGYGRGRDDEAAGEDVRPDPPDPRRQQHPPRDRQIRQPGKDR